MTQNGYFNARFNSSGDVTGGVWVDSNGLTYIPQLNTLSGVVTATDISGMVHDTVVAEILGFDAGAGQYLFDISGTTWIYPEIPSAFDPTGRVIEDPVIFDPWIKAPGASLVYFDMAAADSGLILSITDQLSGYAIYHAEWTAPQTTSGISTSGFATLVDISGLALLSDISGVAYYSDLDSYQLSGSAVFNSGDMINSGEVDADQAFITNLYTADIFNSGTVNSQSFNNIDSSGTNSFAGYSYFLNDGSVDTSGIIVGNQFELDEFESTSGIPVYTTFKFADAVSGQTIKVLNRDLWDDGSGDTWITQVIG